MLVMDPLEGRLRFCASHIDGLSTVRFEADGSHLARIDEITDGQLADVVIDATGNATSMSECFHYAAFGGRVVYVGITTATLAFPHAPVFHRRELTLLASRNALPADFGRIIELIHDGRIRTAPWITHRMAFDEVPHDFERLSDPAAGALKIMVELR